MLIRLLFLILLTLSTGVIAQPRKVDAVEVELIADHDAVVPGQPLKLGLRMRHDPDWHTYWRNPGDSGLPTQVALTMPDGYSGGAIAWPVPARIAVGPLVNYGYSDEIVLAIPVKVPNALSGDRQLFKADAQWLACKEVCVPGEASLQLSLPVAPPGAAPPAGRASLFDAMAGREPRGATSAEAALVDGRLSLVFDSAAAASAEFFPYGEGLIDNPAPQQLYRLDGAPPRWRLATRLANDVTLQRLRGAGFFDGPAGVLVVDGQARELRVREVGKMAQGVLVSQVTAPVDSRVAAGPGEAADRGALRLPGGLGGQSLNDGLLSALPGLSPGSADRAPASSASSMSMWLAVASAFIGGLILNLMPCVFPVIGLKVLGFAGQDRDDAGAARRHALAFAAGVLLSFWLLAALLMALRAAGEVAGWGFQLQSPLFVSAMALLFVAIGLNLSGLFEFGVAASRLGPAPAPGRGGSMSAMGAGLLAVLVATPCTAPFMGSALGFTLGQPLFVVWLVFTALGLGMALPYLLLGWFPAALRWLPRPGRWMQTLRQFLAFPMFATAAWLAWVLGQQAGIDAMFAWAIGAVLLAFACWCYGRFVQQHSTSVATMRLVSLAGLAAAIWVAWPGPPAPAPAGSAVLSGDWEPWSALRVQQGRVEGRIVFVEFTAAWCVSCQANKKLVLDREPVLGQMKNLGVLKLRADWTRRDPAITAELARNGRNGVPLYLVYSPGNVPAQALPELLTTRAVTDALSGARMASGNDALPRGSILPVVQR